MRNLNLKYCKSSNTKLNNARYLLLDVNAPKDQQTSYLVTTNKLYSYNNNVLKEITTELVDIVGAEFLSLDNKICVATGAGEVVLINPETSELNEGTFCDVGIECMSWSPDQEVSVFVTKTHNVVVMTCTFDVLAEHALQYDGDNSLEQFVNVGWGKKETQFHGSEGKGAAKRQVDVKANINIADLPQDVTITWRADNVYFAISFVSKVRGRMFKVFDKEGQLCFVSEQLNNLQPALAWRPSGNWLAMPQRLPQKSIVVLFEKNGLRHRDIALPFSLDMEPIVNITWSNDSDILALETCVKSTEQQYLYLYTICNYHWYLKQTLAFSKTDPLVVCVWDTLCGEEKTLHVVLQSGKCLTYRFQMTVNSTKAGVVGVIDGKKLLLTDFKQNIVPPPMCQTELLTDASIIAFDFSADKLAVLDVHQKLHLYITMDKQKPTCFTHSYTLKADEQLLKSCVPLDFATLRWLNAQLRLFICINASGELLVLKANTEHDSYTYIYRELWHGGLSTLSNIGDNGIFYAQSYDGHIYEFEIDIENIKSLRSKLVESSIQRAAQKLHLIPGLDLIKWHADQTLSISTQCIASDVTSFGDVGNFLIYTQLTSLHFVSLNDRRVINERKIERGAKIVVIMEEDGRIILQMPRGNLEVFVPRTLALQHIGMLLNTQEYVKAFEMLRKHRINLNIICDHGMNAFIKHIDKFLDDIKNSQWLNLFISDLQNEDFTLTMYATSYAGELSQRSYPENFEITSKVEFICKYLCERMENRKHEERFQLPIITAYVKIKEIEKSLLIIWQQYQYEKQQERNGATVKMQANEALRYLLYLVDVNELYNVALGTYDFGLVLYVAQHSQKDPREFLLSLNELKTLPTDYRKFRIDEQLKRYDRALQNISRCDKQYFPEALEFIKRHALYKHALQFYEATASEQEGENPDALDHYRTVALAFGDYLRTNGHFANASLMYERGGNLVQAQLSARNALDWQRVLILAQQQNQDLAQVALSLVHPLEEQGQHDIAFHILHNYANKEQNNYEIAIKCLMRGKLFLKAIYETRMWNEKINKEIIDNIIMPELHEYFEQLKNNLQVDLNLYLDYKKRLLEVRELKKNQLQDLVQTDYNNMNIDEIDLLSDTTSIRSSQYTSSSIGTGKTFRSSKNRRKHERKLLSLKPGNPFEDIALVDVLHNHVTKIIGVKQQEHIRDICKALLELNLDSKAGELQSYYREILELVQKSLDDIWINELMSMSHLHLTGPNIDYTQLKNEQRYALIDPLKRIKPQVQLIDWEQSILN